MQLSEMIDKVTTKTKRPDKVSDARDAINNAISFFTLGASFRADHVETTIAISATEYAQSFSLASNTTRFRRFSYIKIAGTNKFLALVNPIKTVDNNNCVRTNVWYRSGDNIVINLSGLYANLDIGYYQYPALLEDDTDEHWMLDAAPMMIYYKASAEVLRSIGETQEAATAEREAERLFMIAREDLETGGTAVAR